MGLPFHPCQLPCNANVLTYSEPCLEKAAKVEQAADEVHPGVLRLVCAMRMVVGYDRP